MKHCAKCRIEKHLGCFRIKRAGLVGAILMGAHVLFHIAECLIVPSIVFTVSRQVGDQPVVAISQEESTAQSETKKIFKKETCSEWADLHSRHQGLLKADQLKICLPPKLP